MKITYIIPIRIDCKERLDNIKLTVRYLLHNTNGKIIIKESDDYQKLNFDNTDRLTYLFDKKTTTYFHRTKLINEMIKMVETPIIANYDADVLLPAESYSLAEKLIEEGNDLVYPYGFDCKDQRMIFKNKCNFDLFKKSLILTDLGNNLPIENCQYGHCQFFNTKSYINGFMENEHFLPLAPEDQERGIRFQKLGYKVIWFRGLVYHQEHPKVPANNLENPKLKENFQLFENIKKWNKQEILNYYNKAEYLKKYQ